MKPRLLPEAEQEIRDAARWYEGQVGGLGGQFLDAVTTALAEIERHPQRFARPSRFRSPHEVRRLFLPRFPYAIIYEIRPQDIRVAAVTHVRRRPHYWRGRLA